MPKLPNKDHRSPINKCPGTLTPFAEHTNSNHPVEKGLRWECYAENAQVPQSDLVCPVRGRGGATKSSLSLYIRWPKQSMLNSLRFLPIEKNVLSCCLTGLDI